MHRAQAGSMLGVFEIQPGGPRPEWSGWGEQTGNGV